jgi:ribonuclease III
MDLIKMNFLKQFNIEIENKELFDEALTHSSYANEHHHCENYERLEFLGDAVLELIVSDYLFKYTKSREGDMSKIRSSYVCETALAYYAKKLGINHYIKLGHGQMHNLNDTIIADVFEAVLGAIYLDKGYDVAKEYIYNVIIPYVKEEKHFVTDYKTLLQELVQTDKKSLEYVLVKEEGEPHDRTFTIEVRIEGILYGTGVGKSKKEAEQKAAYDAYQKSAK